MGRALKSGLDKIRALPVNEFMTRRPSSAAQPPRVAILVDTATMWGRQVISGIQNYVRRHGPWLTFIEPRGREETCDVPGGWAWDGIIARIGTPRMARALRQLKTAVVNVSGVEIPRMDFPSVQTDLAASGELAATYFLERGFQSFGYLAFRRLGYEAQHYGAFSGAVKDAGHACAVYSVRPRHGIEVAWDLNLQALGAWLLAQPKPLAVLTWNASGGRELLYAAQAVGLRVPEDVAIMAATDDDLFCEFLQVPLSAVRLSGERIGFESARLLDKLMRGGKPPRQPLLLPPLGVATRASTATLAVADDALQRALAFIREHAHRSIQVRDVVRHAGLSRRQLEIHFQKLLQRTPAEEIRRVHLARARELLERTDMPIPALAAAAGFTSPEYFASAFRLAERTTPLKYRRKIRSR